MDFEITAIFLISVAALGFIAGTLGGMLGVGGSVIMIPGLVMLLGQDKTPGVNQHIYQAAAMIANVAVSVPAALRHHKAKATCPQAIKWLLPSTLLFVLVGVWLSNQFEGPTGALWLGRCLAVLLLYVIVMNVRKLVIQARQAKAETHAIAAGAVNDALTEPVGVDEDSEEPLPPQRAPREPAPTVDIDVNDGRITGPRCVIVGAIMGVTAGLMGVGGGAIAVPLQQILLKLPLRRCIANSSAVICISAAVGAIYKNASLSQHVVEATGEPYRWQNSIVLALLLAPTCFIGGRLGAALTHALPIRWVRGAFIALMIVAVYKMAAIPW